MEITVTEKRINHWLAQAEEDIDTAHAMFRSKRWKYTIFMCQQSVEKYLKAIYMKKTEEFPPRIHNLFRLAEKIDKELFPKSILDSSQSYRSIIYNPGIPKISIRLQKSIKKVGLMKY